MAEGGLLPPIIVELKAKATELKAGLSEARTELSETAKESEATSSRMGGAMQKAQGYGKALAVGIAGAAVAVGGFAVEAAVAGQKVDAQLGQAVKNAGGNMEELDPKIKKVDGTLRGFGFTNDDTNAALTRLTVATKDPEKALNAVSVAADLARSRNIPLATATDLVAKAMAGQTGALTRMGINLPIAAGGAQKLVSAQQSLQKAQDGVNAVLAKTPDAANPASKAHAAYEAATKKVTDAQQKLQQVQSAGGDVLKALSERVHGAASAYGDTLAGKVASAKANLENMGEVIGAKLIPILSTLLGWIMNVSSWLGQHKAVLIAVAGVVAALVVPALFAWATAAAAAAAATIAATWPVLAVIAAITALGVGIYELVTHWKQVWGAIKEAVSAVWDWLKGVFDGIKDAFATVVDWIKSHAQIIAAVLAVILGPIGWIGAAIFELATHWKQVWGAIQAATSAVWDWLKGVWNWIKSVFVDAAAAALHGLQAAWSAVWNGIKAAVSTVWDFLKGVWNWISGVFIAVFQAELHGLQSVFSAVWGGIRSVVSGVWGFLQSVWGGIQTGVHGVSSVISDLGGVFSRIWNGIKTAVSDAWSVIKGIFDAITGAISKVTGAIGGVIGTIGKVSGAVGGFFSHLHLDTGGWVPAPKGVGVPATVHGGEYMLSNDMLAGRAPIDPAVKAAIAGTGGGPSFSQQALTGGTTPAASGAPQVTVIAQTNASPQAIASQVGWTLRAMA